jgi:tetratricopeptide (TPR) repeat protein
LQGNLRSPPDERKVPDLPMRWKELQYLFRKAMGLYRRGRGREAAGLFRELIAAGSRDPKHLSYGGLIVATEQGDVKTGLAWCERAVEIAFYDPQMYINLARLHERTGWKTQAAQLLRKGLRIDPGNKRLLAEINRINPRTPDVFQSLPRTHPLNRTLGKLKSELDSREKKVKGKTSPTYS